MLSSRPHAWRAEPLQRGPVQNGRVWVPLLCGRKDDIIKSRGEKVSPKEVENVLYGIEGVVEAAVVGVPDPILGQAVKAFIVLDHAQSGRSLTERDILRHCRAHLEDLMVPKYVEFCTELPKTASGKIKKTDL